MTDKQDLRYCLQSGKNIEFTNRPHLKVRISVSRQQFMNFKSLLREKIF